MDTAWISAFSAVMDSLVGAFTSFVTTYANQRSQYKRDFLSKQFAQRETLYAEFINEAARLEIESLDRQMDSRRNSQGGLFGYRRSFEGIR
jgi:hypothetical protein